MTILAFGIVKDIVGDSTVDISGLGKNEKPPRNVGELRGLLGKAYPRLQELSSLAISVNSKYANDMVEIGAADEIALIPPVSGG